MHLTVTHKNIHLLQEVGIRIILFIIFRITDDADPFRRIIQPEEMWLYRFPMTSSIYPVQLLYMTVFGVPVFVMAVFYFLHRDKQDYLKASLGVSLSLVLTAAITNVIKLSVGRPRPDFLDRCFPDGNIVQDFNLHCTGLAETVKQGYKSFPSGHSSLAFSSLGYVGLYLLGKLHVFHKKGRDSAWKLCCGLIPFLWATLIAVSRTADYHHHWQDVLCGSLLGMTIAYVCYHQAYPSLSHVHSQLATASHLDIEMGPLPPEVAASQRQTI